MLTSLSSERLTTVQSSRGQWSDLSWVYDFGTVTRNHDVYPHEFLFFAQ